MRRRGWIARLGLVAASAAVVAAAAAPTLGESAEADLIGPDHLVVSELMTGGESASDEFVEIYNPTPAALSLGGVELIYVSASGATVTRKAAWEEPAEIPPGGHLLVANGAGLFASIADAAYSGGFAADGGSLALRVTAADAPIDAVGWGSATSSWLEGTPAVAPPAGSSLERLPGGAAGSGQDTDDNALDFVVRDEPDPQNTATAPIELATPGPSTSPEPSPPSATPASTPTPAPGESLSPPASPSATPLPSTSPTPSPTPSPVATPITAPTPLATPTSITIAVARSLPLGTRVTIQATAITDGAFTDGGGYLADATDGIAVLVGGGFARGSLLRISGELDDRYSQRTIRAAPGDVTVIGDGDEPYPRQAATGEIGEAVEGRLVVMSGTVMGSPTMLAAGPAFDLDDGSGAVRVTVTSGSGIDTSGWLKGARLTLVGVVGQRDSTGSGSAGYRVQPRDESDVLALTAPATPVPTPVASQPPRPSVQPSATPYPLVSVAVARGLKSGAAVRIRGVVTMPGGLIDDESAVLADATGAILVRLADGTGPLERGEVLELVGERSTREGMLTVRLSEPPLRVGSQADPSAPRLATGSVGESHEARLIVVRGTVASNPIRSSAGNVYFDLDDGSGPLRVYFLAAAAIPTDGVVRGALVEVTGVVGQQSSGSEPLSGYRLWPRDALDVRVIAAPGTGFGSVKGASGSAGGSAATDVGQRTDVRGTAGPAVPSLAPRLGAPGGASAASPVLPPAAQAIPVEQPLAQRAAVALALSLLAGAALAMLAWRTGAAVRLEKGARQLLAPARPAEQGPAELALRLIRWEPDEATPSGSARHEDSGSTSAATRPPS